jgi:hypothetical protein
MTDNVTPASPTKDDLTRVIVLVYGMLESGSPFWCYVAIKPSRYQPFLAAQKEGNINLYAFDEWGEIIVSGEGRTPPDEVTLKVAEMYQTDPSTLFAPVDVEKEVEAVTEAIKKKPKKDK